jgi:hypothetical protein
MSLNNCPICGDYIFWGNHTCKPIFYVFGEGEWDDGELEYCLKDENEPSKYFAQNEEEAAVKYLENIMEPKPEERDVLVISKELYNQIVDENDEEFNLQDVMNEVSSRGEHYTVCAEVSLDYSAYRRTE